MDAMEKRAVMTSLRKLRASSSGSNFLDVLQAEGLITRADVDGHVADTTRLVWDEIQQRIDEARYGAAAKVRAA